MLSRRIDPDERLVEDEDRGLVDDRSRERDLRLHAFREGSDRLVGLWRQVEGLQEFGRPSGDPVSWEIPNAADVSEELGRRQILRQGRSLRHVDQFRLVPDGIYEDVVYKAELGYMQIG